MSLSIAIGADHAGFQYKEAIRQYLETLRHTVKDLGTYDETSVDYPDFAHPVATKVEQGEAAMGILICGTGNGVAITANKHQGIRAGLCWNASVAQLVRQHNNANILCLPARFVSQEEALAMVKAFLDTPFEGGRHARRVGKMQC